MNQDVKQTFAAASAARAAAQVGVAAKNLLYRDPAACGFADQAYWLCRNAAQKALDAAERLDPEWAETENAIAIAYADANETATLDADDFDKQFKIISIYSDHHLIFHFYDGRKEERHWQNPSRRESRSISENVTWDQKKRFAEGKVSILTLSRIPAR